MLNLLYLGLGAALTFAGSLFAPEPQLGASLPQTPAGFETSLAAPITSTATSMTLTSATTRGGTALSGYNCFTIDAGSAQAEYVCGTVSGTTVSSMTRGIDDVTGTTTNATLKFSHRRGASVQITDFPAIQIIRAQANGSDTFPNVLKYDASTPACGANNEICDYEFITGLAFSGAGVVDGTATAKGVLELATQLETASSSSAGTSGNLAIPASNATSTYNSATAGLRVVVTQNNGFIDQGFLPPTTTKSVTFTGTTTLATSTATGISNIASTSIKYYAATTTTHSGTTTWTKPANLRYIIVEAVAGGSGGTGSSNNGTAQCAGGDGGAYSKKIFLASQLASTEIVVPGKGGAGGGASGSCTGTPTPPEPSKFGSLLNTNTANGDLNIPGQSAGPLGSTSSGEGGDSVYGFGGRARFLSTSSSVSGNDGTGYGGGGSGALDNTASQTDSVNGGSGAPGLVIVTEVYY